MFGNAPNHGLNAPSLVWLLCHFTIDSPENTMSVGTILLIVLILILVGVLPTWPHSRSWGYYPAGGLGLLVLVIVILLVMGRL